MSTFIDRVAEVYIEKSVHHPSCEVILPTRRARLFLNRALAKRIEKPVWAPLTTTLDDFLRKEMGINYLDPLEGLFELHRIFNLFSEEPIPFDRFSKWGKMMLNDFSEIDRYLIDPKAFFGHLEAYKKMEEWMRESVQQDDKLPTAFTVFWKQMGQAYREFRSWCEAKNTFPQGLAFRIFDENREDYFKKWTNENRFFIAAGFNAVSRSEENLFKGLLDGNLGEVLWDYDAYYLENDIHEAGLFGRKIQKWPQYNRNQRSFETHITRQLQNEKKQIAIHGVSGNMAQAKHAASLINGGIPNSDTVLILADETLLVPLLMNLPGDIDKVNVTMGYPVHHASSSHFIQQWMNMLQGSEHFSRSGAKRMYYHVHVNELLDSPFLKNTGFPVDDLKREIAAGNRMVVGHDFIAKNLSEDHAELAQIIFCPLGEIDAQRWIDEAMKLIQYIRIHCESWKNSAFWTTELEFLYFHWTLLNRFREILDKYGSQLSSFDLFRKFYHQHLRGEAADFFGEPLSGLQVMGLLEARALDFKHVIMTSLNEGSLPKNSKSNSLIPYDIKKAYDLPTFVERDAVFAHHFYRAISRAERIDLIYNSSESQSVGEMSRFLHQLKYEWNYAPITEYIITAKASETANGEFNIPKTQWVMDRLHSWASNSKGGISVSALQAYIQNPLEFFNRYILKIGEEQEVEEDIEGRTIGDIVHVTLENIYANLEGKIINSADIQSLKKKYPAEMDEQFRNNQYNPDEFEGKNYLIYRVTQQYIENQIRYDERLIQKSEVVYIRGEEELRSPWVQSENHTYFLQGKVDRIDQVNGKTRILDYKTGQINLNNTISKELFTDPSKKFQIQLLWYAYLYLQNHPEKKLDDIEVGLIDLKKNGELRGVRITQDDLDRFGEQLRDILSEIMDPKIPFQLNREAKYFNTVGA